MEETIRNTPYQDYPWWQKAMPMLFPQMIDAFLRMNQQQRYAEAGKSATGLISPMTMKAFPVNVAQKALQAKPDTVMRLNNDIAIQGISKNWSEFLEKNAFLSHEAHGHKLYTTSPDGLRVIVAPDKSILVGRPEIIEPGWTGILDRKFILRNARWLDRE